MKPFQLARIPAMQLAPDLVDRLGDALAAARIEQGPILLLADPGLVPLGIVERAERSIGSGGHVAVTFTDITSDPRETQVEAAVKLARDSACVGVVALGGGSALDAGKVVAIAVRSDGRLADYRLAAKPFMADRLPLIAIPTTAGTGSEATSVSILSSDEGIKYWYWSPALKPDFILLDPAVTTGLPPALTAATGLDAVVHAMEAATSRAAHPAIDHYAFEAIRLAHRHLPRAVENGGDIEARGAMLLSACYAGIAIDNGGTALAHCAGHALGSLAKIHHGRAVAISMAATFSWIMKGEESRFAGSAEAFGVSPGALPDAFADFVRSLPVANLENETALTTAGLATQMAKPENGAMRNATARTVGDDDLAEIADLVLAFR